MKTFCATALSLLLALLTVTAMDSAEQMRFADGLYVRGMYQLAFDEYSALLAENPSFEQADIILFRIGESARGINDLAKAKQAYARLCSEYPESSQVEKARLRIAEIALDNGKAQLAYGLLNTLIATKPKPEIVAAAEYQLGHAALKLHNPDAAVVAWRKVINDFSSSVFYSYACLALAELLQEQNESGSEVRELLKKAVSKPASPNVSAEALQQLAQQEYIVGNFAASADAYRQLFAKHPQNIRAKSSHLSAAWAYYHAGRLEEALTLVTGKTPETVYLKANCLRSLNRLIEALDLYDTLLNDFPDSEYTRSAIYEKALVAFELGNYESVLEECRRLDDDQELNADVLWLRAESCEKLDRKSEAIATYRQIQQEYPKGEKAQHALYNIAQIFNKNGDLSKAVEIYIELAQKYPKSSLAPQALLEAAQCRGQQGNMESAIDLWGEITSQYPECLQVQDALYQKSMAEMLAQRNSRALQGFSRLLRDYPQSKYAADCYYWSGVIYQENGQLAQAETTLRKALAQTVDPENQQRIKFQLATTLHQQGSTKEMKEAAELLNSLLANGTPDVLAPELLEWLTQFQLKEKNYTAAVEAAQALVTVATDDNWKQIGNYLMGLALKQLDENAVARFKLAALTNAQTPEGAHAAFEWGQLSLASKAYVEAEQAFSLAAQMSSGSELEETKIRSYYGLGKACVGQKKWQDASRYYLSVGVLYDDEELVPECLFLAAKALKMANKSSESHKIVLELQKRYPESNWSKQAQAL